MESTSTYYLTHLLFRVFSVRFMPSSGRSYYIQKLCNFSRNVTGLSLLIQLICFGINGIQHDPNIFVIAGCCTRTISFSGRSVLFCRASEHTILNILGIPHQCSNALIGILHVSHYCIGYHVCKVLHHLWDLISS